MRSALLLFVRGYQWVIRPMLTPSCRFHPSCSCYAHEAISRFGAWRGLKMAVSRIARCHPWNPGGYDPVEQETKALATQPVTPTSRLN